MDWIVLNQNLSLLAAVVVAITTLILLISDDWRAALLALAVQYLVVFSLVQQYWPIEMAAAKLVAGWISCVILGMAVANLPVRQKLGDPAEEPLSFTFSRKLFSGARSGKLVAFFSALLIWLMVLAYSDELVPVFPGLDPYSAIACLLLIGMGLLSLGFSGRPLPTFLALMTTLSGFEIIYAAVESSALMAGLLASVNLVIALTGAYLILSPSMGEIP